jgi:hypothetical protein
MVPQIGYVTRFEQQGDRFSVSVEVQVPENVSHVQLASVHKTFGSVTCARNWELLLARAYCKRSGSGS